MGLEPGRSENKSQITLLKLLCLTRNRSVGFAGCDLARLLKTKYIYHDSLIEFYQIQLPDFPIAKMHDWFGLATSLIDLV